MRSVCIALPGTLHWYEYWRVWTPWTGSDSEQCIWDLRVLPYIALSTCMGTEGFELDGRVATLGSISMRSVCIALPGTLYWYEYWRVWTPWTGSDFGQCIWDLRVLPYIALSTCMGIEGFKLLGRVATLGSVYEICVYCLTWNSLLVWVLKGLNSLDG